MILWKASLGGAGYLSVSLIVGSPIIEYKIDVHILICLPRCQDPLYTDQMRALPVWVGVVFHS